MRVEVILRLPGPEQWLMCGYVSHSVYWKARGPIRKRRLLAAKRRFENLRYGKPWIGKVWRF